MEKISELIKWVNDRGFNLNIRQEDDKKMIRVSVVKNLRNKIQIGDMALIDPLDIDCVGVIIGRLIDRANEADTHYSKLSSR